MRTSSPPRSRPTLLTLLLALAACTGSDDSGSSVLPAAPVAASTTIRGRIVACGAALPEVEVRVFQAGVELTGFRAAGTRSGNWRIDGLPPGTYRLDFVPPAPDPLDPSTNLRTHVLGVDVVAGETVLPPVTFAPVVGGMFITDNSQQGTQFPVLLQNPFDVASPLAPGLEEFSFIVPFSTRVLIGGRTLAELGIDANGNIQGRQVLVEVAIVPPEAVGAPFVDEEGCARSTQVAYVFYPLGMTFQAPTGEERPMEVTLRNTNGLRPGGEADLFVLDHEARTWKKVGSSRVSGDGRLVQQDFGTGTDVLGTFASAGPAPPTTDVVGTVTSGAVPLARAGIRVVTSSGFSAVTDAAGAYRIEGVPIPLGGLPLRCTAFADAGLSFATGTGSAPLGYPETTIDIELPARPLAAPTCVLVDSTPAANAVDVRTNDSIRLRFAGELDPASLAAAIAVTAVPDGGSAATVAGEVAARTFEGPGGELLTDVHFLPAANLPVNAAVTVVVAATIVDVEGVPLAAGCTLTFRTGTSTLLLPRVDAILPDEGDLGTVATLVGANLDSATIRFDGDTVLPVTASSRKAVIVVPFSESGEVPGPRTIALSPGGASIGFSILPSFSDVLVDSDPDPMIETFVEVSSATAGTSVSGMDQNDGTLLVLGGVNLSETLGGSAVVTFGFGDGDPLTTGEAEAVLDAPEEFATPNRIDVRVPPNAVTGSLTVTVDASGTLVTSEPFTFVIDRPLDTLPASVVQPSLDPQPGAVGVPTAQIVRVVMDEPVSSKSELLVGTGVPLRVLQGTTVVTTSADGAQGVLEFFPDSGALPASQQIFVAVVGSRVLDLANNPSADFELTFDTGATAPAPPPGPPPGTPLVRGPASPGASASAGAPLPSDAPARPAAEDELRIARAVAAALPALSPDPAADRVAPAGESAQVAWTAGGAERTLAVAQVAREDGLAVALTARLPGALDPRRAVHVFSLVPVDAGEEAAEKLVGIVADLDRDGRFELRLSGTPASWPAALDAPELVSVSGDALEVELPAVPATGRPRLFALRFESFDLSEASRTSAPELVVPLDLPAPPHLPEAGR